MAGSKVTANKMSPDNSSHKRKRDDPTTSTSTSTPTKKHKKEKKRESLSTEGSEKQKRKLLKDSLQGDDHENSPRKEKIASSKHTKETPADSDDDVPKSSKKLKDSKRKSSRKDDRADDESATTKKSTPKEDQESEESSNDEAERKPSKNKHAGILSKFERTKTVSSKKAKKSKPEVEEVEEHAVEPVIAKGLEPLPQPENPPELEQAPTYSSLPPWLANPLRTSTDERAKFADLGIKPDLLRILDQNNYKEAFAVQSTVIPLLLDGDNHHPGDLCISAATGSGKTLSYVLPLVTSLNPRPASRLRGLIVVPTRELVKQAREACELCASGSRLHIGSAVGNVAIKEEQKLIMRTDQVYNPATVAQRQAPGLQDNDWMDFSLEDCVTEAVDSTGSLPGYIQRYEPNVDILICTPGRLVDHLRYTKGFTLKYLEWLVIDEADRLLNESFQEWVDVVIGSLDARHAPETFGPGGKLLSELGLPIETKPPRKVVLSATMTRDITKLNSLRLDDPKMVIIGAENAMDPEDPSARNSDAHFTLPSTLRERMVAVGDEALKPLYLLRLLLSHIGVEVDKKSSLASKASDSDSTSSDDTSSDDETTSDESSDDDDTSSSGSDSESDSDASSDTSSSDSSDSESESESESKPEIVSKLGPRATTVLIFTKSSESASRLSRLISLLHPQLASRVGTIIKSDKSSASRKTLAAYRKGKISVIVATDRASRGLDLQSLSHVINYDVPSSITTYVHRVGRTARAGKEGSAWSLVAHREGRWFANEIAASMDGPITRNSPIDRVQVKTNDLKSLQEKYPKALEKLEQEVKVSRARPSKSKP
jgi:ATP-dependent RNA helicase DDX51/DBP6